MLSFSFEFPINQSKTVHDFSTVIREWILGSPHTQLKPHDLADLGNDGQWSHTVGRETIESLYPPTHDMHSLAINYRKRDGDIEWQTAIVFSEIPSKKWVSVRIMCESSQPLNRLPLAKKPILIAQILSKLGGGTDGKLIVSNDPILLQEGDESLAIDCILGNVGSYLPIVYVSAKFGGGHLIDPYELAIRLAGMAHVVIEPDRQFSIDIKDAVAFKNVYGGRIAIYWPDGGGRQSFFVGRELESPEEVLDALFHEIRSALNNRRPLAHCTWSFIKELYSRHLIDHLKAAGSTAIDEYMDAFDQEIQAKDNRLDEAEKEINRLKAEIRRYEAKIPEGSGLTIMTGQEDDLYPGELLYIVIETLKDAVSRVTPNSRRMHVLTELYNANRVNLEENDRREQIKTILRDYRHMDGKTRKSLEELGFEIFDAGRHVKLVYQSDERYTFTIPKSGSDFRGGLNAATDISRLLF